MELFMDSSALPKTWIYNTPCHRYLANFLKTNVLNFIFSICVILFYKFVWKCLIWGQWTCYLFIYLYKYLTPIIVFLQNLKARCLYCLWIDWKRRCYINIISTYPQFKSTKSGQSFDHVPSTGQAEEIRKSLIWIRPLNNK